MILPDEIAGQLPEELRPAAITAYLKIPQGLKGGLGETHLIVQEGKLFVLSRNSFTAPLTLEALDPNALPHIEKEGFRSALCLKTADGQEHRLPILLQEREVEELLRKVSGAARSPKDSPTATGRAFAVDDYSLLSKQGLITEDESAHEVGDEPDKKDDAILARNVILVSSSDDEDEDDEDDDDEDLLAQVDDPLLKQAIREIQEKRYTEAAATARALSGKAEDDSDKEDYEVLARALDSLGRGDVMGAFLLFWKIGYLPGIEEAFEMALGSELVEKGEPVLAFKVLNMSTSHRANSRAMAIQEGLGLSEQEIERCYNERCVDLYRQEIAKNPADAKAWTDLSWHLKDLKRYDEAIESAKRAIELNPEELWPYLVAGDSLREKGLHDEALSFWNQAATRFPDKEAPYERLGKFYEEVHLDFSRAIEYYQKGFQVSPSYYSACEGALRTLLQRVQNWSALAMLLEKIIERSEDDKEKKNAAIKELVEIYEVKLGDKQKARQWRSKLPEEERSFTGSSNPTERPAPLPAPLPRPRRPIPRPKPEPPAQKKRLTLVDLVIWMAFLALAARVLISFLGDG